MATANSANGMTALRSPKSISVPVVDRAAVCFMVAASLISTTASAPAAITQLEDTARRSAARPDSVTHVHERRQHLAAIKRIQELAGYPAGWNGPDSMAPTIETVRQATGFVQQIAELGDIEQPYISLADDGEINFYWKTKAGLTMDLGFTGTSRYSYYAETRDGREFIEDGAYIGQPLPAELITALRA